MKTISAGSLDHGRFEDASDGPACISMILDEKRTRHRVAPAPPPL